MSRLVEQAARGEPFIIAKAGKPLVKMVPLDAPAASAVKRLGLLSGQITVPDDFDRMHETEIARPRRYDTLPAAHLARPR